jgi:hypothetical protein
MKRYVDTLSEFVNGKDFEARARHPRGRRIDPDCRVPIVGKIRSWGLLPLKCALCALLVAATMPVQVRADLLSPLISEGTVLPNYAVVSVGPNASMNQNSGPISGSVLVGIGSGTSSSGGGNGAITGGVQNSGPPFASGNLFQGLQNPPIVTMVPAATGTTAFDDAAGLSTAASALTPTVGPLGNISGARTFAGNGGLNVIDIGAWSSPQVTLTGGPDDIFVFNLTSFGTINTAMNIDGVLPGHILWNLTGTGNIFQTSGGGVEFGTFLTTTVGANFQFSNLNLTGQLINTGGNIQFVSGSKIPDFIPFAPTEIPEPASAFLLGTGLLGFVSVTRRKLRKPRF